MEQTLIPIDGLARDKWISVESVEPPKDGTRVLLLTERGVFAAEFGTESRFFRAWWVVPDGKNYDMPLRGPAPTHWMPLPEPPKDINDEATPQCTEPI